MTHKKPNKVVAPIIIVGITVGFLASAYKFVFANKDKPRLDTQQQDPTDISKVQHQDQEDE